MRAAVFKAPGTPLVIENVPDPTPEPEELLIEVRACGICGTDLHWTQGTDPTAGWRTLNPGAVLGHEFSGEIVEVGRDLRGKWKVGERVCAQPFIGCGRCPACLAGRAYRCPTVITRASDRLTGAYAQLARIGATETLRLPEAVDYHTGALVEPLAVGLAAVRRARLQPGDNALIIGAGPVGLAVAMFTRHLGASHVVVSDLVGARAERATEFGATAAIDASREDVRERFERITGGPPSVVYDCVGVPGSMQLAIDHAPPESRVVVVGLCMAADHFFPARAIVKELDIAFAYVYTRRDFEIVVDLLGRERIDPSAMVTAAVDLDHFPHAFEALRRPTDQIKVMVEPNRI
ncbi:MAG: alcohol dehydrogenase catalytic domain-containing protein [Ectothiorhodospiraceae bacterium]|nr:alcohol dehydrogenase catalytic domain-containing protein [Planctomycetota bacterium]MCP5151774.1 alcohol dehydrogenase catalytic domain-containing protein [Chromatiales bacterium]MCP5154305.1 alcohol dehydrogenase catalytic domain-containing protein [Ectothiorhodospiraceae bacterium]